MIQPAVEPMVAQHARSLREQLKAGFDFGPHARDFNALVDGESKFLSTLRVIADDPKTTDLGKQADRAKAAREFKASIAALRARVPAIRVRRDSEYRDMHAAVKTTRPNDLQLSILQARLMTFDRNGRLLLYESADESTRAALEALAQAAPVVPERIDNGGLAWVPLIDPAAIKASVMARAEAANPIAAQRVRDLDSLVEVYEVVANTAEQFLTDTMAAFGQAVPEADAA
jgi:hypothetical protein